MLLTSLQLRLLGMKLGVDKGDLSTLAKKVQEVGAMNRVSRSFTGRPVGHILVQPCAWNMLLSRR